MPLVQAKCTNCGAALEVDNTQDAMVCKYCGNAFVVEKAINNYTSYVTNHNDFAGATVNITNGNIDNLLKLANSAIGAGNGEEAITYSNRALEIDPESTDAWLVKMKAVEYTSTIANPKTAEIISYGSNAINCANENEKANVLVEVYTYYLSRAKSILLIAIAKMNDTAKVKQIASLGYSAMQGAAKGDATTRTLYLNLGNEALKLKMEIPKDIISSNNDIQDSIVALCKLYGSLCEADVNRISIYGSKLLDTAIESRTKTLNKFKQGLPDEKKEQITDEKVSSNSSGCYIATCVYGSYDCPQVWTLRRYRDNILAETWYGRAFIHTYYAISPTIVKIFGNTKWFKKMWKGCLDRMVNDLNLKGVEDTPYKDKTW